MQGPAPTWLVELFGTIDARDAARFAASLAPDALFRFGNAPPVAGRAAIQAAVAGFFGSIAGCRHELARHWRGDDSWVVQGTVHYTRLDGSIVSVPFVDVFLMSGAQVREYLIYIDIAPLFAAA
jgi:ketosteroid isomerase-like protein